MDKLAWLVVGHYRKNESLYFTVQFHFSHFLHLRKKNENASGSEQRIPCDFLSSVTTNRFPSISFFDNFT